MTAGGIPKTGLGAPVCPGPQTSPARLGVGRGAFPPGRLGPRCRVSAFQGILQVTLGTQRTGDSSIIRESAELLQKDGKEAFSGASRNRTFAKHFSSVGRMATLQM